MEKVWHALIRNFLNGNILDNEQLYVLKWFCMWGHNSSGHLNENTLLWGTVLLGHFVVWIWEIDKMRYGPCLVFISNINWNCRGLLLYHMALVHNILDFVIYINENIFIFISICNQHTWTLAINGPYIRANHSTRVHTIVTLFK